MTVTSGEMNIATKNSKPVMIEAIPVRAPSPMPDADSIYEVLLDTDAAPPATAAMESTTKMDSKCGISPFSSRSSASPARPKAVPIVSKKSLSIREKIASTAATTPMTWKLPNKLN